MHQESIASNNITASKQHFKILDGLRGIAAISVVVFHFMEIAVPDYAKSFIAHAYQAVDFFFCLSGFVIAYAYDQKLIKIGIPAFLKLRLIRLHPLVVIGSVIGILAFVFDPFSNLYQHYSDKLVTMFLASVFMIPYALVRERYFNNFHLNPPTWSLFWEYIANICYAFFLVKIPNKILWILTGIGAVLIVYEAYTTGTVSGGWSGDTIWGGGIRVFYSFLAGMLVYRSKWIINSRLNFITVGLLLFVTFLVPYSPKSNHITEPLVIIFYFPLLIALGAGARSLTSLNGVCNFFGEISYPLYMVHYPFIWLFMSYVEKYKPSLGHMTYIIVIGTSLLILFAYLIMILIDIPVRQCLKKLMSKSA